MERYDWWMDPLTERDEWRCVWVACDGGQFVLAIKNWQELFVHKWDTSLKVMEDLNKITIVLAGAHKVKERLTTGITFRKWL